MSIKQTISTPIYSSPNGIAAIVDEANDGVKALPTELVVKKTDDSGFQQVNQNNPLPITGNVQLTGSNTVVKEFKGNTAMISNTLRAYGQSVTSGGSVVPLDVSEFKCKTIFLRNNHDKTIKVNVRFHADLISTSGGGILLTDKAAEVDVPAGQRMYITSCDYPTLKEPCVGLSVLLSASSAIASGSLDLIVLGGRT